MLHGWTDFNCFINTILTTVSFLDDDFFIFILLSQESDGDVMHRTNPDSLRSSPCY